MGMFTQIHIAFALVFTIPVHGDAERWHSFSIPWDKAPVNLSFLLDAPAGKHGFLGIKGGRFVFEDGTEARFWGTTLTGSACFPPHDLAPQIAERLSRFGINLVRLHHLDADWAEPNLFQRDAEHPGILDPETLDRLDYLIHQLANRGVYVFLDGLSSRRLRLEDGIEYGSTVPPGMKGRIYFSQNLRQCHYDFLEALWCHRSRYSGREYRDTPSIVMTQLLHDNNLFLDQPRGYPYKDELEEHWQAWQHRNHLDPEPLNLRNQTKTSQRFISEMMGIGNASIANFLRSIGVKVPLTATNAIHAARDLPSCSVLDFINIEGIWNPPLLRSARFANRRMTQIDLDRESHLFSELAFARLDKKPFVVSKWGHPWPNEYRAELPLWMAAMACQQDWQGCVSSTYRSVFDPETNYIIAPLEAFNDPCFFGLMPAAGLLFHHREPKTHRQKVRMALPDSVLFAEQQITPSSCITTRLVDHARISVKLGTRPSGRNILASTQPDDRERYVKKTKKGDRLIHDPKRGIVLIDTPRTQAAIGSISSVNEDDLASIELESKEEFGVICVSSLDKDAIPKSRDLFVTVVSQARNRQFRAIREKDELIVKNVGLGPVSIKETPVQVTIHTRNESWEIHAIAGDGTQMKTISSHYEKNRLTFKTGIHGTLYYRLSCKSEDYSR